MTDQTEEHPIGTHLRSPGSPVVPECYPAGHHLAGHLPAEYRPSERRPLEEIKEIFVDFLHEKGLRETSPRLTVLRAIDSTNEHFDVNSLFVQMRNDNKEVCRATIYNTVELLLECNLLRKHQFGKRMAQYEKTYQSTQHDHVIMTDTEEMVEFYDPRIQAIKESLEKELNMTIDKYSLCFYGTRNQDL
ncbi:MAG: Fur family transcriptional regulator [Bacteroidota bacterium]